jgi:hypothetical protein
MIPTQMTQTDVNDAISKAFANLAFTNHNLYDYWISELYDVNNDEMIVEAWNEKNLKLMEDDVMREMLLNQPDEAYILENDYDDSMDV